MSLKLPVFLFVERVDEITFKNNIYFSETPEEENEIEEETAVESAENETTEQGMETLFYL